jgi:hypothetical protein
LGSACVSRAGERVLAIANFFSVPPHRPRTCLKKSLFRRDGETNTRDARATRNSRECAFSYYASW